MILAWSPPPRSCHAIRELSATDLVILNHEVTRTTPELAPPFLTFPTTPTGGRLRLGRFNVHPLPTWRVLSGTRFELTRRRPRVRYLDH
ncbi:hypothetical protein TNCV_238801 [Trichonephila clavipes]|nr:hypothetical protein TNCV_238801 [Trichonephila clavipes]